MNEVRLKGRLMFPPRKFSAGVSVVIRADGDAGGTDCTAWESDAPEAVRVLAEADEGAAVTVLGKLARKKEKRLGKLDKDGNLAPGDVYVLGVNIARARIDEAPAPKAKVNDDEIPW